MLSPTEATRTWLEEFVIGLNLCPFAGVPFRKNEIKFVEIPYTNEDEISEVVRSEIKCLLKVGTDPWTTTLMILQNGLSDFVDFNDYLDIVDEILDQEDATGVVQAASFHPNYLFGGEDPESQSHFTNRSPYPLIHLIREEDIDHAKLTYPGINEIPRNNIEKLKGLNKDELAQKLKDLVKY
jgi:hypothetical protein